MQSLEGMIRTVTFHNEENHFTVARLDVPGFELDDVVIKGTIPSITKGQTLRVEGEWIEDRTYGWNFRVNSYTPIVSSNPELLESYLGSGMIKGVGPATAKKIVKHFGDETLHVLDHEPERLTEVPKIPKKLPSKIAEVWQDQRQVHDIMVFLQSHGISPNYAQRLFRHYGNDAARVMESNPYRVSWEVYGFGFAKADEMAQGFGIAKDSPDRIRGAFHHILTKSSEEGHTHLPRESLIQATVELLGLEAPIVEKVFETEVDEAKNLQLFLKRDKQVAVALKSLYLSESGVARLLSYYISQNQPLMTKGVDQRIDDFEKYYQFQLAPEQREAIHQIAAGGVSVVTGGPGTGKTTLIRALLFVLKKEKLEIALCSPTGRAAQRLSETTGHFATTIHRLLKFNPQDGGFVQRADNPLKLNLLIIDESSMLDIALAYHLLKALTPGTSIVFVGDIDQLPSVGAGSFLQDLIESGRPRITRLNVIFRQANQSAIIRNSHRVNEGRLPEIEAAKNKKNKNELSDFFIVEREEAEQARDSLLEIVTNRIPKTFSYDPVKDVQILSPMRRGILGTDAINVMLQEKLNTENKAHQIGSMSLRVGDKVIQTSNNYDLDVYNGDIGFVERISRDQLTFCVQYGKKPVEYQWSEIDQIQLAYAITIHKSQGSEYPVSIILMHNQHFTMLQRKLLYTGITRGKKLVMLIGSQKAIRMAVQNVQDAPRLTNLAEWLCFPPEGKEEEGLF